MFFDAYLPTTLVFGVGRFAEAGRLAAKCGDKALVVTSRQAMERLGHTARLRDQLHRAGVTSEVFHELASTPTTHNVDAGAERARRYGANLIVALGGGTAIDAAKAIAAVAPHDRACEDYLYERATPNERTLPLIAIPTTAGTGSEMNRSAILTDESRRHKDAIRSDYLFPKIALVDPELTYALPADVTARTGFDALAHAIESYVSPRSQPIADGLARSAIQRIVYHLPIALDSVDSGEPNAMAREQLAFASTTMGYNLSCVGTCLPHRLDKPLCARFPQLTHGQAIALFYPKWIRDSWPGQTARFAEIARALEPRLAKASDNEAASACGDAMTTFLRAIGMGQSARELDVVPDASVITDMASKVRGDLRINPVAVDTSWLLDYYTDLLSH